MELEDFRREYLMGGLRRKDLALNPLIQFETWMQEMIKSNIADPTAMTVATVDAAGQPEQRIVLLKHVDQHGFVFYTNYASAKARDIDRNPKVSLHFPWYMMERQVTITGVARKVDEKMSHEYFNSRPRDSQLAALASRQSQTLESRKALEVRFQALKEEHDGCDIPAPDFWGGFVVEPRTFEFWQGGANRLHDRFLYRALDSGWVIERLAP